MEGEFGIMDEDGNQDSYVVNDTGLTINSFNGVYLYPEVYTLGKWIIVPPQCGTYSGPAAGLDRIYGFGQNIVEVYDIGSTLSEKEFRYSHEYQKARHQAGLPLLGYPFEKYNPDNSIPEVSEEDFIEMEE
jgi:hypothetical protein